MNQWMYICSWLLTCCADTLKTSLTQIRSGIKVSARTCGPPLPFVSSQLTKRKTKTTDQSLHEGRFLVETLIRLCRMIVSSSAQRGDSCVFWHPSCWDGILMSCGTGKKIHLGHLGMYHQRQSMLCWKLFSPILSTTHPVSPLFFLCWFKNTENLGGHCVCADISWFSASPRAERERERKTKRETESEQSHPPKTLNWLRVWMLPSFRRPWVDVRSLPVSSLLSLSGSLWVLAVEGKCLWRPITTWHCTTSTALSDCLHELPSLFGPHSVCLAVQTPRKPWNK